jgi:hypothetical protein
MARRLVVLLGCGVLGAIGALLFEGRMLGKNSEADKDWAWLPLPPKKHK